MPLGFNGSQEQNIQTAYLSHLLWAEKLEKARLFFLKEVRNYNLSAGGFGFDDMGYVVVVLRPV